MMGSVTSVELHRYLGPADSLGRCIIGDVVTYDEFLADESKWVDTWVHSEIFARLMWMSQRGKSIRVLNNPELGRSERGVR